MAKDKKAAKELTMEEKLAQALVPVEEQPYKIPENWCWVYLTGGFAECLDSFRKPINATERVSRNGDIPYYGATGQVGWINDFLTDEQLVLVGEDGAPFLDLLKDKAYIIKGKAWVNNHAHVLRSYFGNIGNYYLLHYLNCFDYTNYVNGTTRLKLTQANMNRIPVPLSPLKEQGRIVDRIESIFSKLDEAKEKAQAVVAGFELRKSAILHKAFTGELTKQWRKSRGISIESWRTVPLIEISTLQTGIMKGKHFNDKTICLPYLRVANVQDGYFNLKEIKRIEVSEKMVDRYLLQKGDVLFTEGGDFDKLGRGSVWNAEIKVCLHQNHVFVVRPDKKILDPYFLSLQAGSRYGKKYFLSCAKQTTNLASINSTQLKNYPVRLPVIEEQKAILNMVSDVLKKERQVKDAAELVISQIDVMKKAVLVRAFRGELGTNDLLEEKSVELLKLVF